MAKYTRDASIVLAKVFESKERQIVTKVPCKIQVPARFSEVGLGEIGVKTYTYGLFAIILETGEYAVCNINAIVELNPYKTTMVNINGTDYHEFHFLENTVVITTIDVIQKEAPVIYNILDELVFKGKVPWYVAYEDLGKLFDTAKKHAGSAVGDIPETIEFIASMVTRSKEDKTKYICNVGKSYSDFSLDKISYVPLKSVFYSVNSTLNKLAGNYFNDGVVSALVNPSDNVEKIESILRA